MDDGLCIETNINRQSIIISFSELWVLYIYDRDRERDLIYHMNQKWQLIYM